MSSTAVSVDFLKNSYFEFSAFPAILLAKINFTTRFALDLKTQDCWPFEPVWPWAGLLCTQLIFICLQLSNWKIVFIKSQLIVLKGLLGTKQIIINYRAPLNETGLVMNGDVFKLISYFDENISLKNIFEIIFWKIAILGLAQVSEFFRPFFCWHLPPDICQAN